jgi:hypothetical protein
MPTNVTAVLLVTLVTNVTNLTVPLPTGGPSGATNERYLTTNVFERSTVTWTWQGQTNSAASDKLIYTATQVLRLRQVWEPSELRIQQPR